jgi:hypothetical protein
MTMERQRRRTADAHELTHRRAVAGLLYARAATLLPPADGRAFGIAEAINPVSQAVLRATAACLQALAAQLEAPAPAFVPVPVATVRPRRRRGA